MAKDKYIIQFWSSENERNLGYGNNLLEEFRIKTKAIERADELYNASDLSAVEVIRVNGKRQVSVYTRNKVDAKDGEYILKRRKKY